MNHKKIEGVYYRPFQLTADFPLVALLGDQWTSSSQDDPITRMHFHNCYEIGYLYQGSGILFIEDEAVSVSAPGVIVIPPNTLHETRSNDHDICHWRRSCGLWSARMANRDPFVLVYWMDCRTLVIKQGGSPFSAAND